MSNENEEKVIIIPGDEWREKVITELNELTEKLVRLRRFIGSEDYYQLSRNHTSMLRAQARVMSQYADILAERLERN